MPEELHVSDEETTRHDGRPTRELQPVRHVAGNHASPDRHGLLWTEEALEVGVAEAAATITASDAASWIRGAGYRWLLT